MNIFENYNKAKQKFGENIAQQAIDSKIPNQFVFAACKFNVENGTPFNDLYNLFSQWTTYVAPKNKNINIDILDYDTFWTTIQEYKKQYEQEGKVYDDGTVSISHISSFEQMKKLPIKNLWCIRREKRWNEYQENGAVFYLIINNNYTDDSNCRYVMVEMYSNGEIGYWSTDNELIDEQGSTRRLPPLAEYQQTLGNALQKIQELQEQVTNDNQLNCNANMNKKLIRITESDLRRIVRESVKRTLNEELDTNPLIYRESKKLISDLQNSTNYFSQWLEHIKNNRSESGIEDTRTNIIRQGVEEAGQLIKRLKNYIKIVMQDTSWDNDDILDRDYWKDSLIHQPGENKLDYDTAKQAGLYQY